MEFDDEAEFRKAVASLIEEDLHLQRGLTEGEYTAICRKAWDSCQASLDFPFKLLFDPLQSAERLVRNKPDEYTHWRAADVLKRAGGESTEIRCTVSGLIKPDFSTGASDDPPLEPDADVPEFRRYLIGVFDVLGFSAMLEAKGLEAVTEQYGRLITEAVTKPAMRTYNIIRFSRTQSGSIIGALPVQHAHFSDTILLWVPLVQHYIAPFFARCADMVCEALQMELPLRGAVSAGRAVMHPSSSTFIGPPIVEAAKLEQAQDWLGVSLGASMLAADISREFDPTLVVPYRVPLKRGKIKVPSGLALDWPNRFRERYETDPITSIQQINRSPAHGIYYKNAEKFAAFSAGPIFRSDGLRPFHFGELAQAAVAARAAHAPLERDQEIVLDDLVRAGTTGTDIATFVKATATGEAAPPVPQTLPLGMRRALRELSLAADGAAKYFNLSEYVIGALRARHTATPLDAEIEDGLTELQQLLPPAPAVARFCRDLASGHELDLPRRLPRHMRGFLKQAIDWVTSGEVTADLLGRLANECLEARIGEAQLGQSTIGMLDAVRSTGGYWPDVVTFLHAIAAGDDPPVPDSLPSMLYENLTRIRYSATPAGVQQPRTLDILGVGIGDPPTGVDLLSVIHALADLRGHTTEIPSELLDAIETFETGDVERRVAAQRLRGLVTGAQPEQEVHLPMALRLFLTQMDAIVYKRPIPVAPSLVGLAAIRSRHGGGEMGDCISMSLPLMARANAESRALAEYLWRVAHRRSATPVPNLTDAELRATAEEVRCLADPHAGGIRMMMSPARPEAPAETRLTGSATQTDRAIVKGPRPSTVPVQPNREQRRFMRWK
ncbi:MAG: hypothetical protein ACYC7A_19900 [Thermoanaerobaculia bacterium]